ncbi:MAG TPA: ion channel [Anaeromyxobacter sp.]|nr:ion channel [Anaeromyxobacter sp.]
MPASEVSPFRADALRTRPASWVLLAAFVLEIFVLSPLVGMGVVPLWAGAIATTLTLVAAAMALGRQTAAHGILVVFVLFSLAARWGHSFVGARATDVSVAVSELTMGGLFAFLFLKNVFSKARLPDRLLSVLLAYLFIGAAFGGAYHLAELLHPGALSLPGHAALPSSEFNYFSFTTLTSVGFGDIVPVRPLVRSLAALEALTGQLYLLLVVSRFIGEWTMAAGGRDGRG